MRYQEFAIPILEGYKEALVDFSSETREEEVRDYLEKFRDVVKRNKAKGDERNIDHWRKQGWDKFKNFVDDSDYAISKRQIKRQKQKTGKSIILRESDQWLIVIPLDKEASCFHGKNTSWCTTKPFANYYEQYFYDDWITLIYCLNKQSGDKWAIAYHEDVDSVELFDQNDSTITAAEFTQQTGLDSQTIVGMIDSSQSDQIQDQREKYNQLVSEIRQGLENSEVSKRMESLLAKVKHLGLMTQYISGAGDRVSNELTSLHAKITADAVKTYQFNNLASLEPGYAAELVYSSDVHSEKDRKLVNSAIVTRKDDIQKSLMDTMGNGASFSGAIRFTLASDLARDPDLFMLASLANRQLGGIMSEKIARRISSLPSDTLSDLAEKSPTMVIYNADPSQITVEVFKSLRDEYLHPDSDDLSTRKNILAGVMEKVLSMVHAAAFQYTDDKIQMVVDMPDIPEDNKEKIIKLIREKQQKLSGFTPVAMEYVQEFNLDSGFNPQRMSEEMVGL